MGDKYIKRLLHRLGLSLGISLVFMLVLVGYMENIQISLREWFLENISDKEEHLDKTLFILSFVFCLSVFILTFLYLSLKRTRYIRRITNAVDAISKGNLQVRIPENGRDELSYLAASINSMTEEIGMLIDREKNQENRRQEFITKIAHDLRTPMTSIIGYLRLLEQFPDMNRELVDKYLGIAIRKSIQLQDMVEEMFTYMKLCEDDFPLNRSELDLVRLVEQVADELYPIFEKNDIELVMNIRVKGIILLVDGALMARLFDNLINNAIKYGKEGKKIIIDIEEDTDEELYIFRVTNYGKILSPEEQIKVFEKFYRTDSSRSSSTGGAGLGLSIAANIVRLHGGRISCRSDEENGTSFIVVLPVQNKIA